MALIQFDGFETDLNMRSFNFTYSQHSYVYIGHFTDDKRTGNYSWRIARSGSDGQARIFKDFNTNSHIMISGVGYKTTLNPMSGTFNLSFVDTTSNIKITLQLTHQNFKILKDSTIITSEPIYLGYNSQYYLEFKCILGNPDGTAQFRVGHKLISDITNYLLNTPTNSFNRLEIYYTTPLDVRIDDLYLVDGSGDITDFLGPCTEYTIGADSLYDNTGFTPVGTSNYVEAVRNLNVDGNKKITSNIKNSHIEYKSQLITTDNTIFGLKIVNAASRISGDGPIECDFYIKNISNGNKYTYAHNYLLNTDTAFDVLVFNKNVFTNNSQNKTDINNLVYGIELTDN